MAAITGLVAKENVVGTFGILYGFAEVAEDGTEILGNAGRQHDRISGILLPGIQPSVRALFCGNGRYQERNEQCKMVLVRNRLPDRSGICGFPSVYTSSVFSLRQAPLASAP